MGFVNYICIEYFALWIMGVKRRSKMVFLSIV